MKKIIYFSFALLQPVIVHADYIEENERIFKAISSLEDQLKELELKQKIQKIELEIKENELLLSNKMSKPVTQQIAAKPSPIKRPVTRPRNIFEPNDVKLLYLVGSGLNRNAVVNYKSSNNTLKNNSLFNGWRVSIVENEVALVRGDKRVAL